MPSTEEEEFLLCVPPWVFQFSQYEIHQHREDETEWMFVTQKNIKLFLSDLNESRHYTFDIQSGKTDGSSKSIPYKVCCGNRIPTTGLRNWYSFYCHALQFPLHRMGMKFPRHCVGILFLHHIMGMKFPQNSLGMKFPQTFCGNWILFIILRPGSYL